jgi:CRP/FNR family transcriptional regulator, cyclic AMP receptor protein
VRSDVKPASPSVLSRVPLFADLPSDELEALSARLRRLRHAKGDVIFRQGDPGTSLYIIQRGTVNITLSSRAGQQMILARLGAGEFFGEMALLDGEPRSANAVATDAAEFLLLDRDDFLTYLEARPKLAVRLLVVLARRLRNDAEIVQDAAFLDVPARLARIILQMSESTGQPSEDGTVIGPVAQTELAAMVGARRETVNKWIRFYERHGLIRSERGRITILKPESLQKRIY